VKPAVQIDRIVHCNQEIPPLLMAASLTFLCLVLAPKKCMQNIKFSAIRHGKILKYVAVFKLTLYKSIEDINSILMVDASLGNNFATSCNYIYSNLTTGSNLVPI
jgi:hypothetical protein